jgi:hypothetical protein
MFETGVARVDGMCLNRNTDLKSVTRQEPNLKDQMYRPLAIYGGACDVTFEYSIISRLLAHCI